MPYARSIKLHNIARPLSPAALQSPAGQWYLLFAKVEPNGPCAEHRFTLVTGGQITGNCIGGVILAGGSDGQLIQPEAVAELGVRVVLDADNGMRHCSREVVARLRAGEHVDAFEYYFREKFIFESPPGRYDWRNNIIGLGIGERNIWTCRALVPPQVLV